MSVRVLFMLLEEAERMAAERASLACEATLAGVAPTQSKEGMNVYKQFQKSLSERANG